MHLPPDKIMRTMAKMAIEQATLMFARRAREFAQDPIVQGATAEQALNAFANAIESTNASVYPINESVK
jgi:hypothetical protein